MSEPTAQVTPARACDLAADAKRVEVAQDARSTDDNEHRRRAGFRLEGVAGEVCQAAPKPLATADDLARLASVPTVACALPFGTCPEHVNTITYTTYSGGQTRCRAAGCGCRWGHDGVTTPCAEPQAFHIIDNEGQPSMTAPDTPLTSGST